MPISFQEVRPNEDYTIEIAMTNGNRITMDMKPFLNGAQYCALWDKTVWRSIRVREDSLLWDAAKVDIPMDTLLELFRAGKSAGTHAAIRDAVARDDWRLLLLLDNGNLLSVDVEPLLEFSVFAPLVQRSLWKTLQARANTLIWEDEGFRMELTLDTLLDYFNVS